MITTTLFYFLSALMILSALMVVFSRNPMYSVLYMVLCFFAIAGHFLLLNAQFLAAVHIVVYAGAIMVLFLYTIMLINMNREAEPKTGFFAKFAGVLASGLLLLVLVAILKKTEAGNADLFAVRGTQIGLVKTLGMVLYKEFLLPFEIASILFLVAIIGAVVLGKKETGE